MPLTKKDIEKYLAEVKTAIAHNRYRLERNPNRQDNNNLFLNYVLDEARVKSILLDLEVHDFSDIVANRNPGYEQERLYIFGKTVELLPRYGTDEETVPLYIKINKLNTCFVIVISFHEQKYPLKAYFA